MTGFSVLLFGLAAHGYRFFHLMYSHDSLLVYQPNDTRAQISIGRFLLPLYLKVRGAFYPPFLVGMLSLLFLAGAAYLVIRLLEIRGKGWMVLTCGTLAASGGLTLTYATYLKDADVYMLALLLAAAGAAVCARFRYGFLWAAPLFCLSMGLYQTFFQAAVFLCMAYVIRLLLEGVGGREALLAGVRGVASLLLGLALYYAALRIVLRLTGTGLSGGYNGLTGVGQFGGAGELLGLIRDTFRDARTAFLHPETVHSGWVGRINLLLVPAVLGAMGALALRRRLRGWELVMLAGVTALLPFGINVVYFISKGVGHSLTRMPLALAYPFAAMVLERFLAEGPEKPGWARIRRGAGYALQAALALVIFTNVVYANQVYLKKDLEQQATLSLMTRIVDRVEQLEGYVPGETRVALVGRLEQSPLALDRQGLSQLPGTGMGDHFAVTYHATYGWYFRQILGYPVNLMGPGDVQAWGERPDVADMPAFPAAGACAMVDGVATVRLS